MSTQPGRIRSEADGAVLRLTLNRPEKRNALDSQTISELCSAIASADGAPDIRVVLITGAGKDFCAGADLAQLERIASGAGPMENLEDAQALGNLFVTMRRCSKPIVAAVQGNAIAGGAGLATACDVVLAADTAVFGYPEVHLGFVPAMVMALLRRIVGEKRAFDLVIRGDLINAPEAYELGIVTRVFQAAELETGTLEYTTALASRPASAVQLTKRLFYGLDGMAFEDAIARGAEVNALARFTDECRDGVARFLDKQKER